MSEAPFSTPGHGTEMADPATRPGSSLIDQAGDSPIAEHREAPHTPAVTQPPFGRVNGQQSDEQAAPASAPPPAAASPAADDSAPSGAQPEKRKKKLVNFRIDPDVIDRLELAQLTYSFQKRKKFSQTAIVELAIREWLVAHDLWDIA